MINKWNSLLNCGPCQLITEQQYLYSACPTAIMYTVLFVASEREVTTAPQCARLFTFARPPCSEQQPTAMEGEEEGKDREREGGAGHTGGDPQQEQPQRVCWYTQKPCSFTWLVRLYGEIRCVSQIILMTVEDILTLKYSSCCDEFLLHSCDSSFSTGLSLHLHVKTLTIVLVKAFPESLFIFHSPLHLPTNVDTHIALTTAPATATAARSLPSRSCL